MASRRRHEARSDGRVVVEVDVLLEDGLGVVGEKHGELTARVRDEDREVLAFGEAWLLGEARGDGEDR